MTQKRLHVDFRKSPPQGWAGMALAALGLGLVLALAVMQQRAQEDVDRWRQALLPLAPDRVPRDAASPLPASTPEHLRAVLARLQFPWDAFFDALESTPMKDVALLSIAPDTGRGTVLLRGEARDIYAALRYVEALGHGGYFRDVGLVEHEIGTQNPQLPVRFAVTARWTQGRKS